MSRRPTGITVLTILVGLDCVVRVGVLFMCASISGSFVYMDWPLTFFLLLLHSVLAHGLWTRARWAWTLALVLDVVFVTLSILSLVTYSAPATFGLLLLITYPLAMLMYSVSLWLTIDFRVFLVIGVVIGVLFIWYLMQSYVKTSFTKAPSATATKQ